ncbi:hypothetical protein Oweho_2237 [Owenweeksia hongkongensis DSM 17368]|uniref:Uncharacterized protein n=1 Tax=Owenweeksia hongkongensis (strain DSM 17368 / CIP 108786 / JCM 12287 / NRRL B-23963 / UST20020801) TaxID=926562 RepID=G8R4T7_OWEHD|nr:hypothetical protein [Owenweeksia hongkongensis]AEV33211.1 hypothetical protein Oweho_2237 [Owenweeksia hongkongensis DSM 17368]
MNNKTLLYLSVLLVWFLPKSILGQKVPQTSIAFSEVQNVLGVEQGKGFALVYRGDTLASFSSNDKRSLTTFFDEEIRCIYFEDSVEYQYSLPHRSGVFRLSLSDSLPLFEKENLSESNYSKLIRYDSMGAEKYKEEIREDAKIVTRTSGKGKEATTIQENRWFVNYTQENPDSSYFREYNADSVLQAWSYVLNMTNGERIHVAQREDPFNYTFSKTYYERDTNYNYRFNINPDGDTLLNESFSKKFKELDSTYYCADWSGADYVARSEQYHSLKGDSSYSVNSQDGLYYSVDNFEDSLEISKSFDLQGNLIYRTSMEMLNGDYGVEETLEQRDTFYHEINYFHGLQWGKGQITEIFPYIRRVYLDEDSAVVRVLDYSFEKQDEWPVLTITEGDTSWIESMDDGGNSKYAPKIGVTISNRVGWEMRESTYYFSGTAKRKTEKLLGSFIKANNGRGKMGFGVPPFYILKNQNSVQFVQNLSGLNDLQIQGLKQILSGKGKKAVLYINDNAQHFEGTFAKLFFEFSYYVQ